MKGNSLAIGLVVLAAVFLMVAGLYYEGVLQFLVTDSHAAHHPTHAVLFTVLAVATLIAANFARTKRTA